MSYEINLHKGYGSGSNGNKTAGTNEVINNYARVTYLEGKFIKLDKVSGTGINTFSVGQEIMLHVSGYKGTSSLCTRRGFFRIFTITDVTDGLITLDRSCANIPGSYGLANLYVQAITIPHFKTLTLNSGKSITCPNFNYSDGTGGIVAFKCSVAVKFNGGHINLLNHGMPDNTNWEHGWQKFEPQGDTPRGYFEWRNIRTKNRLCINYPDGAVFFAVNKMICHEKSRIGNPENEGALRVGSIGNGNANCGIHGGASILIAANEIEDWTPKIISKYPEISFGSGARGYSRCYIASETTLPTDEGGLYAYDRISDTTRLQRVFNIKTWGDDSAGVHTSFKKQFNCYAQVSAVDKTGKVLTIKSTNQSGYAKLASNALVMVHSAQKSSSHMEFAGKFFVTRIAENGIGVNTITLTEKFDTTLYGSPKYYNIQIISIPQFQNLTINHTNAKTPAYDKENGIGGILALACSDTCDLSGAYLDVSAKGGAFAYGEAGLDYIGNASMCERLPIGEGHGSIFILAQNLIMNSETRLGAVQKRQEQDVAETGGNYFGGVNRSYSYYKTHTYAQNLDYHMQMSGVGTLTTEAGMVVTQPSTTKEKRSGTIGGFKGAGLNHVGGHNGGFGSNSTDGACQGAHLLIIANKITGFNLNALCTGGDGGKQFSNVTDRLKLTAEQGGCGYGGSGGTVNANTGDTDYYAYRGGNGGLVGGGGGCAYNNSNWAGGGGSGGFCFIYCNKYSDANFAGVTS